MLDDPPQADIDAVVAQSAHHMTEVPLGLALVMGLREALTCKDLVGDLGLPAPSVRVVDPGAVWSPLDELSAGGVGRPGQRLPHAPIPLRI